MTSNCTTAENGDEFAEIESNGQIYAEIKEIKYTFLRQAEDF
jgi:hypothetical protein